MLIEGGYIVTNAHVVWPFDQVRVVFPDGSEYLEVPVLNLDLMGDLAVVGPIQTSAAPLPLVDREDLAIGSDLFLVGYPAESEEFPLPTITQGILSRLRDWKLANISYFQTDAAIAGGQSGGVLVSDDGEAIGISGFSFSEAQFGLVASAADILPRVEILIAGEDISGLAARKVSFEGKSLVESFELRNIWDTRPYVINEPPGTTVNFEVQSSNDAVLLLVDTFGNLLLLTDETVDGDETMSTPMGIDGPRFLLVTQNSTTSGEFRVESSHPLAYYADKDDDTTVKVGQTLEAAMDYPLDIDFFVIVLNKGDTIEVTAESLNVDPVIQIDFPGSTKGQVVSDDDSGGGIFGTNARLVYRAPHSGSYHIVVNDATFKLVGGYFLTVAQAPTGAIPVAMATPTPMPTPTPTPLPTPTPTPLPPLTLAYQESFEIPNSVWGVGSSATYERRYFEGEYRIFVKATNWTAWKAGSPSFSDFDVRVKARYEGAKLDKSYGLVFRYEDRDNFYTFQINPISGKYRVRKQEGDKWANIIGWTKSPHINLGTTPNLVRVVGRGSAFEFYANGKLLGTAVDKTFTAGRIGLYATNIDDPDGAKIYFDDLIVYEFK